MPESCKNQHSTFIHRRMNRIYVGSITFMFAKIGMHVSECVMKAATEENKNKMIFVFHNSLTMAKKIWQTFEWY